MADSVRHIEETAVLLVDAEGAPLRTDQDAVDLIGSAGWYGPVSWVVVPVRRFDAGFFQLSTRIAGEIVQKFVNYRLGLAILGDVSEYVAASTALRDYVTETNRGRHVWFVPDLADFTTRLARARARGW